MLSAVAISIKFSATPALKIVENHLGIAFIKIIQQMAVVGPTAPSQEAPSHQTDN